MLAQVRNRLPALLEFLHGIGEFQLARQGKVTIQVKSDSSAEQAWEANEVVSEVDRISEERLLGFFTREFGPIPVVSEEFHAKEPPAPGEYCLVLDPLDGTKPYLEGKQEFGISVGLLREGRFVFGLNYYPSWHTFYYAFANQNIFDHHHAVVAPPRDWLRECYVAVKFYHLLREEYNDPEQMGKATGVRVGDYPRSATYIFKRMIEGNSFAYLSKDTFIWDIGPSSLLLEQIGCRIVDIEGKPVDFRNLSQPPFCQPVAVALPKSMIRPFLSRLKAIVN